MNNTNNIEKDKVAIDLVVADSSSVFVEKQSEFKTFSESAYADLIKKLQKIYNQSALVPNRMQTFAVQNLTINLSDDTKVKNILAKEIFEKFKKLSSNNLTLEYLELQNVKDIEQVNIDSIIYNSIEIENDVSAEKIASVRGSFDDKLVNIKDLKDILDISNFSVPALIQSILELTLTAMDIVDIENGDLKINFFRLIPVIILSAKSIYDNITEDIDPKLYSLIYFIVTQDNARDGMDQSELIECFINEQNDTIEPDNVIEQIKKLIDYRILSKDENNKLYLITKIKTKEVNV